MALRIGRRFRVIRGPSDYTTLRRSRLDDKHPPVNFKVVPEKAGYEFVISVHIFGMEVDKKGWKLAGTTTTGAHDVVIIYCIENQRGSVVSVMRNKEFAQRAEQKRLKKERKSLEAIAGETITGVFPEEPPKRKWAPPIRQAAGG